MTMPSTAELLTRLKPIEELWDSIARDPAAATDAERALLDQRLREHSETPSSARAWADVRAELLERGYAF